MSIQVNPPNRAALVDLPLYGEAAAIHAMYQSPFLAPDREQPPPRKPRRGLLERLVAAVRSQLPVPAYAQ